MKYGIIIKKSVLTIFKFIVISYILVCVLLYFSQEKLIFFPEKLNSDYRFTFNQNFNELNIKTEDGVLLSGILFKADSSKGLIFYLHGNGSSIPSWGEIARTYTDLHYDLFMLDYRGYGKSSGSISSEKQIFADVQTAYDTLKAVYKEDEIIILGYSIGTGPATKLASTSGAKLLILQAPYYSLTDMMKRKYSIIPRFLLKYIRECKMPVIVFHGDNDEVIDYSSSLALKKIFKPADTLITLKGQGHNGMSDNPEYLAELKRLLMK
jgi:pimeloyl-ACP methyl ester carboxylesterase